MLPVGVSWRRYASGIPWYMASSNTINGQTTVWHGGPAVYMRLEVNPAFTTDLMAT